jgi:hypothetical protein
MLPRTAVVTCVCFLISGAALYAIASPEQTQSSSVVGAHATQSDIQIVHEAQEILSSSAKWNRNDTGDCPPSAATFSIRCALKKARQEVAGNSEGGEAVMEEARELVDAIGSKKYDQRLIDYNNDPTTTFADVQAFLRFLENRVTKRLSESASPGTSTSTIDNDDPDSRPPVTKADLQIVERAKEILSSPDKWNRADTRECPTTATRFSIYCALEKATDEVSGNFQHRGAAMQEARFVIDDTAPNAKKYSHRLMDYNNDPTTTFADLQNFFRALEDRIAKRIAP